MKNNIVPAGPNSLTYKIPIGDRELLGTIKQIGGDNRVVVIANEGGKTSHREVAHPLRIKPKDGRDLYVTFIDQSTADRFIRWAKFSFYLVIDEEYIRIQEARKALAAKKAQPLRTTGKLLPKMPIPDHCKR